MVLIIIIKTLKTPTKAGQYKYNFKVAPGSAGKTIFIVFEASMTETEVKINGKLAGPIHQGGFYRFKYDVTKLLNYTGDNVLEATVKKRSANESVNQAERKADFWLFGGIFRPVYLEILPQSHIDRISIDAKADGDLKIQVYPTDIKAGMRISAQVQTLKGVPIGLPCKANANTSDVGTLLKQQVKGIMTWDPEDPNMYNVVVSLTNYRGQVIHRVKQRFGFRTAELRPNDGFYVNNKKVIFKGVCRHSEWPESARALSKDISLMDVRLMKEMNMNAVRMSHYPPDQHFLDVCDSLGMFVLDEVDGLAGKYDTIVGRKLVKELVVRDVNHPSIVIWDNGNEGGWNTGLDGDFAKYDPQNRLVIHPWEKFNGTDTKHYPDYNYVQNSVLYGREVFFPTEFMHGLEDGGHGAGLDDFWGLMLKHPFGAGGFLWSFHDEGVARTDRKGQIDIQGNAAPDGILGPHREKEASYYTIKEIWSPVQISLSSLPQNFDGTFPVENRYIYTNLSKCKFSWKLSSLPKPSSTNTQPTTNTSGFAAISLAPGEKGFMKIALPANWKTSDVLYVTAVDAFNKEIFTWSWAIRSPNDALANLTVPLAANAEVSETETSLIVKSNGVTYYFDKATGNIQKAVNAKATISLSDGPVVAGVKHTLKQLNHYTVGADLVVEPIYTGGGQFNLKWTFSPGKPARLDYQYTVRGDADFWASRLTIPKKR